eukprot:s4679_g3.t1
MFRGCCVKVFSRKQEVPALSSAEAELYSFVENAKELIAVALLLETILAGIELDVLGTPLRLEPLKDVMEKASKDAAAREAAWTEPSASKHGDGEAEIKSPPGLSVDQAMELEQNADEQNAAKRRKLTAEEVAEIGVPDTDLILQMMRLCKSSLEYTARQYCLSAINQASGNLKSVSWQLSGGRQSEHQSCKSLLQSISSSMAKMEKSLSKMVDSIEHQNTQSAEQSKQMGEVLIGLQAQVADAFSKMSSGTSAAPPVGVTPTTPMGGASVNPMGATPVTPMGGATAFAASAMGATAPSFQTMGAPAGSMGTHHVPPPPAPMPVAPPPGRGSILIQVRSPDGQAIQRAASPTRYVDEVYRTNPSFLWCDDGCFRRLI